MSAPCVILTAAIAVKDVSFTLRTDTATRLNDYKQAFLKWVNNPSVQSLVLVENSGFDLTVFQEIADNIPDKKIELLSFACPAFDGRLGKGYGESFCLEYASQHSKLLNMSQYYLKVTGRYYLRNAHFFLDFIVQNPDVDVVCDLTKNLTWADSRVFGGKAKFLEQYLCPLRASIDDSAHIYIEHVLARAIHMQIGNGGKWELPPELPDIEGISATINASYHVNSFKALVRRQLYQLKRRLLATHSYLQP